MTTDPRQQRCGLCVYWPRYPYAEEHDLESGLAGGDSSECRKHAPVVTEAKRATWPWTGKDDWCGEFKARWPKDLMPPVFPLGCP